jgi:hypothetical protein
MSPPGPAALDGESVCCATPSLRARKRAVDVALDGSVSTASSFDGRTIVSEIYARHAGRPVEVVTAALASSSVTGERSGVRSRDVRSGRADREL